jgi:hypothetical protein
MAFIIWYQLTFPKAGPLGLVPLRVSNDVFSGDYILDGDIRLTMSSGDVADRFVITLTNLPVSVVEQLKQKQREGLPKEPLEVEISLGYFEDAPLLRTPDPVMVGAVTAVESDVNGAGLLVTRIEGQERAGYGLRHSGAILQHFPGEATPVQLARHIEEQSGVTIAQPPPATPVLTDYTLSAKDGLAALRTIARLANAPLVIRDNAIFMGPDAAIGRKPVVFSPDRNLVRHSTGQVAEAPRQGTNGGAPPAVRERREVTVLGQPELRIGQAVELDLPGGRSGPLHIAHLEHNFSTSSGYVCDAAVVGESDQINERGRGADVLVERFRDLTEASQAQQTAIDVGEVIAYEPGSQQKHLATLKYGQTPAAEVAPSVNTAIDDDAQLQHKPIASPFAWHKCGLMVPVYPGMRALLAHNQGMANDAVVAGFLWSERPVDARPQNEAGDYWLCLPTALGGDARPVGKGVNDLTNAEGLRVIEVKGLRIAVGAGVLSEVGQRPATPTDLADSMVVEHQSGARITIAADGAISLETGGQAITLTTGGVTLKVTASGVEVS